MLFHILTIFPEFFNSSVQVSLLGKALKGPQVSLQIHNIRDQATDKHHKVDDTPYGGGPGMVLKAEPIIRTVESIQRKPRSLCLLLTPRGELFSQKKAQKWKTLDELILICGRYEGVDERVSELVVDEEISIGDYILNGGEAAALVVLETIVRLLPGVVGNETSLAQESFQTSLLEYPQYTRPEVFRDLKVPQVLLEGDHKKIIEWRRLQALKLTYERRSDLLPEKSLNLKEKDFLKELQKGTKRDRN